MNFKCQLNKVIPYRIQIDSLVHIETGGGLNLDCLFYLSSHLIIFFQHYFGIFP